MSALVTPEQYVDLCTTTVAGGGYTSGSGVLNVGSTGAPFPAANQFHFYIADQTTGVVKCIGKATAVNSGTQWAVTMTLDANANAGDVVAISQCAGAMDQIRADQFQTGTYASLPSTSTAKTGDEYQATDCPYRFRFNGTTWDAFNGTDAVVVPAAASLSAISAGSATLTTTGGMVTVDDVTTPASRLETFGVNVPSPPFTYTVKIEYLMSVAGGGTGVYNTVSIGISDGTGYNLLSIYNDAGAGYNPGLYLAVDRWNSTTSFASETILLRLGAIGPIKWLRYVNNNTNSIFQYSNDGYVWYTLLTESKTAFLTATKFVVAVNPYSTAVTAAVTSLTLLHLAQT